MIERYFAAIFSLFTLIHSFTANAENRQERDQLVREAAISWIRASELSDVDARFQACRKNVNDFLPILGWILEGEKVSDIFTGSSLSFFLPVETLAKMKKIDQFVEQTQIFRTVMTDLLNAVNPRLQKRVVQSSKWLASKFTEMYLPTRCDGLLTAIKDNISRAKFSDTEFIDLLKNQESGISFDGVPEKIRSYLTLILEQYYDHLPFSDKSRIIKGLLKLPIDASTSEQLSSVLMRSGPILQKSFQLFGSDVKDPLLLEVMGKLRSQIKPFSPSKVEEILNQELSADLSNYFASFDRKPVAAATIGQVHMGTLHTGESVVVKVKRPGIQEKANSEIKLLRSLTNDQAILNFIDELEAIMQKELDFLLEKEHLHLGKEVYHRWGSQRIQVIAPLELLKNSNNVIVMDKAKGQPIFANVEDPTLSLKREALVDLLERWFEEAIFGSGFFHADLHGGNIFIEPTTSIRRIPLLNSDLSVDDYIEENEADYRLWLIDFGSVGSLSKSDAGSLLKLIIGLSFQSNDLVLESLKTLMALEDTQQKELIDFLDQLWAGSVDELSYLDNLLNKIISLDLPLPKNLILFYRGKALLERQIHGLNTSLSQGENSQPAPKHDPLSIYRRVLRRNLLREILPFSQLRQKNKRSLLDQDGLKVIVKYYLDRITKEPEIY